jgi:hypothetical protein
MSGRKYLPIAKLQKKQNFALKRNLYAAPRSIVPLPISGSVKNKVQEVYDQGSEGSCTANAFCAAYRITESDKSFNPSRQYVYWKERLIESGNNPSYITDSGADVEDAVHWVSQNGVCSEASWPYNPANVDVAPPASCDVEAAAHKLGSLTAIQVGNNDAIKHSIINGIPVLLAIGVYQSFESDVTAKTGIVSIPKCQNFEDSSDPVDQFMGGHEVLIVGYYDKPACFTVLNSWGSSWGHGGYCYIPYSYVSNPKLTYELCCLSPRPASIAEPDVTAATATPVAETATEPVAETAIAEMIAPVAETATAETATAPVAETAAPVTEVAVPVAETEIPAEVTTHKKKRTKKTKTITTDDAPEEPTPSSSSKTHRHRRVRKVKS